MCGSKHWTDSMFIDHSELFLLYLEERLKTAKREAGLIKKIFDSRGVPEDGKILDVCCGIGRHSVELARMGYNVVGIDLAPRYIELAEKAARRKGVHKKLRFVLGDIRDVCELVKDRRKFDGAISMFTSFGYYGEHADLRLFRDLAKVCKKNAALVLETINRDWIMRGFLKTGIEIVGDIEQHEFRRFNFDNSHMENIWKFYRVLGEERKHLATIELNHRIYSAHELLRMLKGTGWRDATAYDGLRLRPLDLPTISNRLVVVASRQ